MPSPTVVRAERADRETIVALEAAAAVAHGHAALGEAVWRDLDRPGPGSAGFLARSADGGHLGYVHVAMHDSAPPHWAIGLLRQPRTGSDPTAELLDAAVAHIREHGGGDAIAWVVDPGPLDDAALAAAGFAPDRDLLQLRVALPLTEPARLPVGFVVRDFVPGADDAAWLAVNNRAFAGHPEQGRWSAATLARRMDEPWFDASLFLVAEDATGIAGFNWLKRHPAQHGDRELGEIFVIGVDPRARGTGLGRALALAGLDRLARRGIGTGMLFVDAANTAALGLYRALGFTTHRLDRAYRRHIEER